MNNLEEIISIYKEPFSSDSEDEDEDEETEEEVWQPEASSPPHVLPGSLTQPPPFRKFRIGSPEEAELLTAIELHRPFIALYGDKVAAWGRVRSYLTIQDTLRMKRREQVWYTDLKQETCKRRWSMLRKLYEQHQAYLEKASGVSPLPSRELDRIQALYELEESCKQQSNQAKESRQQKREQIQQNRVNGAWLRDQALQYHPRKRIKCNSTSPVHAESTPGGSLPSRSPSIIQTESTQGGSLSLSPSLSPTTTESISSHKPWSQHLLNSTDIQALVDRADHDSALLREQREALNELKEVFLKDIGDRRKERAEQKQSDRERMEVAQHQHNDIVNSINEQQKNISRQQDLMFEMIQQMKSNSNMNSK